VRPGGCLKLAKLMGVFKKHQEMTGLGMQGRADREDRRGHVSPTSCSLSYTMEWCPSFPSSTYSFVKLPSIYPD
jgi:hypothetical protein